MSSMVRRGTFVANFWLSVVTFFVALIYPAKMVIEYVRHPGAFTPSTDWAIVFLLILVVAGLAMLTGILRLRPWALWGAAICCAAIAAMSFLLIWNLTNAFGQAVLDVSSVYGQAYMMLNLTIFLAIICVGTNSAIGAVRRRRA